MPDLPVSVERAIIAATAANREAYPPVAIAAIGKVQLAVTPAIFGGMRALNAAAQPLSTTPEKIVGWSSLVPDHAIVGMHPEGVLPDVSSDEIHALAAGHYMVFMVLNADVSTGAAYVFEIYVNGVASGVRTAVDLSNQTGFMSQTLNAPITLEAGDVVSVYGNSDGASQQFDIVDGLLYLNLIR